MRMVDARYDWNGMPRRRYITRVAGVFGYLIWDCALERVFDTGFMGNQFATNEDAWHYMRETDCPEPGDLPAEAGA